MTLQLTKKHSFDEVFDSQKVFRLLLEAMSNPMRVVNIREYAEKFYGDCPDSMDGRRRAFSGAADPAFLALAMTLLDNEVSFYVCENQSLSDEIASLTLAKRDKTESADYIFVDNLDCMEYAIENAKQGTLADPHKSATVIIANDGVYASMNRQTDVSQPAFSSIGWLTLSGPGIEGYKTVQVTQAVKDAIALRDAQNYEYPEGIDLIFVSGGGGLLAVPRLVNTVPV